MSFDYYYNQVPIEMRCLAPWQGNKHADEIWAVFYWLMICNTVGNKPVSCDTICERFNIYKYKKFRRIIKPLINTGMVNQMVSQFTVFDKYKWTYEVTEFGKAYYYTMIDLILPRGDA
jgi:hypothetical protein